MTPELVVMVLDAVARNCCHPAQVRLVVRSDGTLKVHVRERPMAQQVNIKVTAVKL